MDPQSRISEKIEILIATVALLVITGCTTAISPNTASAVDLEKKGLVLATLRYSGNVANARYVRTEIYLWRAAAEDSGLRHWTIDSSKELWLIELPIGHYRIADWRLGGGIEKSEGTEQSFEFDVRPGEVTYLGEFNVAMAPSRLSGNVVYPRAALFLEDRYEKTEEMFRKQYSSLSAVPVRDVAPLRVVSIPVPKREPAVWPISLTEPYNTR